MGDNAVTSQDRETPQEPTSPKLLGNPKELGTVLHVTLVEDSLSVLSLGHFRDELGCSCMRKSKITRRLEDHHMLHRQHRSCRLGREATNYSMIGYMSNRHDPARRNPVPSKEVDGDSVFECWIPSLKE